MKEGSLVVTVGDFEELRRSWGYPYPKKGDVLTVSSIEPHPVSEIRNAGIVLLNFQELPGLIPVCDRKLSGGDNFQELQLPNGAEGALSKKLDGVIN